MAYVEKVAAKRGNPISDVTDDVASRKAVTTGASNQEQGTSASSNDRTVSTSGDNRYNEGSLVRVQGNTKGTGKVGVPTSVALSSKDWSKPAVANPDGEKNRPGKF